MLPTINYTGVIIAAIANMVIGFAWYSMPVFGKPWMKLLGMTKEGLDKAKKEMGPKYGLMVVSAIFMAAVMAVLVEAFGVETIAGGVKTGLLVWLGFVATTALNGYLFESKPLNLYFINAGYYLVALIVQGVILAMV